MKEKDLMEQQQHGFSDSTSRAGSDRLQKLAKNCLVHYNLCPMSTSQISTQKYGLGRPALNHKKNRPIGGRLRNHSHQSEHVLRILKLYFAYFKRMK